MNHLLRTLASVLLGAVAIVGCQREPVMTNPTYDPDTNTVTTQFVLSVNTGQSDPATKMSADAVQKNGNFLGIDDASLISFKSGLDSAYVTGVSAGERVYPLGTLYSTTAINNSGTNNRDNSSRRVFELDIDTGVDAFLFYGRAIYPSTHDPSTEGHMIPVFGSTPADISFSLLSRMGENPDGSTTGNNDLLSYYQTGRLLATIINAVLAAEVPQSTEDPTLIALTWKSLYETYKGYKDATPVKTEEIAAMNSTERALAILYYNIVTVKDGEYRAGSSSAIQRMIKDVYASCKTINQAQGASDAKTRNAQRLAGAINTRILTCFNPDIFTFLDLDLIKTALPAYADEWDGAEQTYTKGFHYAKSLNSFPSSFHIPEGAAQLGRDSEDNSKLVYKIPNRALLNPSNLSFHPTHYVYPVTIGYYANSPIYTSTDGELSINDYPNGAAPWEKDASWGDKWKVGGNLVTGKVSSSTRGIALRENINYGVALLKTQVQFQSGLSAIHDNRENNTGEENLKINTTDANFTLRGVLVGGQHKTVGWQCIPTSRDYGTGTENYNYVLYDDAVAVGTAVPSTAGTPSIANYTLLFDNYMPPSGEQTAQETVRVALEFVNGGADFWGKDNLIRSGGVFYLLAELKPTEGGTIVWPTDHQVPPIYGANGEDASAAQAGKSKQVKRVFIQSYETSATFVIGDESLRYAYSSVPDLRSTQMSLGLSVDLRWRTGLSFETVFGPVN